MYVNIHVIYRIAADYKPEHESANPPPGWWETRVLEEEDEANIDSAYSTVALPPHTDGNYWEDPPGNLSGVSGTHETAVAGPHTDVTYWGNPQVIPTP